jgi:hypothetical protein
MDNGGREPTTVNNDGTERVAQDAADKVDEGVVTPTITRKDHTGAVTRANGCIENGLVKIAGEVSSQGGAGGRGIWKARTRKISWCFSGGTFSTATSRAPTTAARRSDSDASPSANRSATSTAAWLLLSVKSCQIRRQHAQAQSRSFRWLSLSRKNHNILEGLAQASHSCSVSGGSLKRARGNRSSGSVESRSAKPSIMYAHSFGQYTANPSIFSGIR